MISIAVTGLDGSGKSTQVEKLKNFLVKKNKSVVVASIWDSLTPLLNTQLTRQGLANYLKTLTPDGRASFMMSCLLDAKKRSEQTPADYLLWNSHIYKYWATELCLGANPDVFNFYVEKIKAPDFCISLDLEPELAFERKSLDRVSSYECGLKEISKENFITFQKQAQGIFKKLIPAKTLGLEANQPEEIIFRQIAKHAGIL